MNDIFLFLFLVCLVAAIVGIIKPQLVIKWGNTEKRNRKNVLKYYGIGLIVFFIYLLLQFNAINKTIFSSYCKL